MTKQMNALICAVSMMSTVAYSADQSAWLARVRGAYLPQENSQNIRIPNSDVQHGLYHKKIAPEIDLSHFFTPNIALELAISAGRASVFADKAQGPNVSLGNVSILPVSLTAQYYVMTDKIFSPYVGAGAVYNHLYDPSNGPTLSWVSYRKNNLSPVLQVGTNMKINQSWSLNVDVKKAFIRTHVDALQTSGNYISEGIKINPWAIGFGVGYSFG